jgi:hypothetical protein
MAPRKRLLDEIKRRLDGSRNGNGRHPSPPPDQWPEHLRGDQAAEQTDPDYPGDPEPERELGTLLSSVQPERVEWLWPDRVPLGKLTILDGDPGLGKSLLTLDLAARVSRGMDIPDGTPGRLGGVVLLTAEDGLADTVAPRLEAAGADRSRILALDLVPDESGLGKRLPALPEDAGLIRGAVKRMEAILVVVDPLSAFLGQFVNSHKDKDCRRALWPLASLAEETGAAVVTVRHLNKATGSNPLYRGGGSIAIIGAARSGLLVAKDPDNEDRRILASTKCNLARLPVSWAFGLDQTPTGALRIDWIGPSGHHAADLLAAPRDDEDRDAIEEAKEVLSDILQNGPQKVSEITKQARQAGVADMTLRRAKAILGVRVRKTSTGFGEGGFWAWSLPEHSP